MPRLFCTAVWGSAGVGVAGAVAVADVAFVGSVDRPTVLGCVAAAEAHTNHPIARALVASASSPTGTNHRGRGGIPNFGSFLVLKYL